MLMGVPPDAMNLQSAEASLLSQPKHCRVQLPIDGDSEWSAAILHYERPLIQNRCSWGSDCGVMVLNHIDQMHHVIARRAKRCPATGVDGLMFDFSLHFNARCLPWLLRSPNLPAFPTIEP
jgi:hypothetical protein